LIVTTARHTSTPNATMVSLATPTQGSTSLSTWRVTMQPGAEGPVHAIDREQIWMPLKGSLAFTANGETTTLSAGQAAILPANETRQVKVVNGPAEALVCMPIGAHATIPGNTTQHPLPWAE
jgi:quercetin dioxygenase-like cupin family protein